MGASPNNSAQYSAFGHLWRSVIPVSTPNREDSLFLMLELAGYFDESGTHDGSPVVTLAGYVARVKDWDAFEPEWNAMLTEFRVPYSHMTDIAQRQCPFGEAQGWTEAKRVAFLSTAHEIINRHIKKSFDISLMRADFDAEIVNYKGNYKQPSPYVLLVNAIMLNVGKWACSDPATTVPINYVFEQLDHDGEISRTYNKAFNDLRSGPKLCLGRLAFAEGKIYRNGIPPTVQLQAADMHAYEINKLRVDNCGARPERMGIIRKSLQSLRRGDQETNILHRDIIKGMVADLNLEAIKEREERNRNEE